MTIEEIEQKSFAFIDENIDATFYDVPEDLFKIWHITTPLSEYMQTNYESKYEYRIYRYALEKFQQTKGIVISEDKVLPIFKIFQLMLSIPVVRKKKECRQEKPLKIFNFQFYAELL